MLLEEMIHAYWRDSMPLRSAVPLERFFTGPAPIPVVPCVVLVNEKTDVLFRSSRASAWRKIALRFELHHESLERGIEIARLIDQSFDRLNLREPHENWSFLFRYVGGENLCTDNGVWKFVRRFQLIG